MTATIKTMTRAQELSAIIEFARENDYNGSTEKLEKVLAQWTAPRERKVSGPSKVAIENAAKADEVLSLMPEGEAVTNVWVTEQVNGIMTTNKAAVIMGILVNRGAVVKQKVGKVMTYTRA